MITIAIELNNVIRNVNKQYLKYYQRDFKPELDTDEIKEKRENVLERYIKFDSKKEKNEFIYIDYPYEIFGCAKTMEKDLARDLTKWMEEMTNREDEEFRVIFFSMDEDALTIQSSYFFLSRIGTRVREVIFPKNVEELKDKCDVIIASNMSVIDWALENDKKTIRVATNWENKENEEISTDDRYTMYQSMTDIINDNKFLDNISNGRE